MSELESIAKLRGLRDEAASKMVDNPHWVCKRAEEIADEIEAEIAERYQLLPVDADGVPVRVGDCLQLGETRGEVVALTYCPSNGELPWEWQCDTGDWYNTAFSRHVKPRTIEDVLADHRFKADQLYCDPSIGDDERADALESLDAECAAEIRAMFGEVANERD